MLEHLWKNFVRGADECVRMFLSDEFFQLFFMLTVGVGVNERDSDGIDPSFLENSYGFSSLLLIEWGNNVSIVIDTLRHLQSITTLNIGISNVLIRIPDVLLRCIPDLMDVSKSLSCE